MTQLIGGGQVRGQGTIDDGVDQDGSRHVLVEPTVEFIGPKIKPWHS